MKKTKMRAGFTLIEIMVVLVIIGLLATIAGPKLFGNIDKAKITTAQTNIKVLKETLEIYKMDNGQYPTTDQGLDALVKKPEIEPIPEGYRKGGYMEEIPKDPWGREYIYRSPTDNEDRDFEIISYGADGQEGGEDYDADITSYVENEDNQ